MASYETCFKEFNDTSTQLEDLLSCISTEESAAHTDLATGLDAFFLIYAGALVFFMQTGFAMLCAGSIRAKNAKNVLLWNLLDSAGGGIAFWVCGYAFAYGGDSFPNPEGDATFVGNRAFFMQSETFRFENWFFQFAFACAVSSIIAGTVAERMQMRAYLLYSFFTVGFVYPVVAHSFWSIYGFLSAFKPDPFNGIGVLDFAGSGAVHMLGGVGAFVAAIILGPRVGRFYDRDGNLLPEPHDFPPHSVALQFLGTFALWFGWYGFNPGSTLKTSTAAFGEIAALAAVNTTLAACSGALSAMFTSTVWDYYILGYHTYDLTMTMNGCLCALAAITAGCAVVDTWAAVVIGIVAGWTYMFGSKLIIKFRIDDAVDAIPVHMFGGAWGLIATGLFAKPDYLLRAYANDTHVGWFYEWGRGSGDFTLIGNQLLAVVWVFGWTGTVLGAYFYFLNFMGWFRVSPLEEEAGMDISRHKGACYDISPAHEEAVKELNMSRHSAAKAIVIEEEKPPIPAKKAEPMEVDETTA